MTILLSDILTLSSPRLFRIDLFACWCPPSSSVPWRRVLKWKKLFCFQCCGCSERWGRISWSLWWSHQTHQRWTAGAVGDILEPVTRRQCLRFDNFCSWTRLFPQLLLLGSQYVHFPLLKFVLYWIQRYAVCPTDSRFNQEWRFGGRGLFGEIFLAAASSSFQRVPSFCPWFLSGMTLLTQIK